VEAGIWYFRAPEIQPAIVFTVDCNVPGGTVDIGAFGSKDSCMELKGGFLTARVVCLAVLLLWAVTLRGQSSSFVVITPQSATLLMGESRSFRLVDQNGQFQRNVTWTTSDPDALQPTTGDELTVTAKQAGEFHIGAQSRNGSAEATVKVMEGKMPVGTAIWTSPRVAGCKPIQLVQAMPSANGPDMYDTSHCEDGDYITALTSDGITLWRRRVGGSLAPTPSITEKSENAIPAARLDPRSPSICNSLSTGTGQQAVRDLLHQRNLSFSETASGERVWTVEESNSQCKLWFDDKLVLVKKRKIFVTE
jgi:hypothetical protein